MKTLNRSHQNMRHPLNAQALERAIDILRIAEEDAAEMTDMLMINLPPQEMGGILIASTTLLSLTIKSYFVAKALQKMSENDTMHATNNHAAIMVRGRFMEEYNTARMVVYDELVKRNPGIVIYNEIPEGNPLHPYKDKDQQDDETLIVQITQHFYHPQQHDVLSHLVQAHLLMLDSREKMAA